MKLQRMQAHCISSAGTHICRAFCISVFHVTSAIFFGTAIGVYTCFVYRRKLNYCRFTFLCGKKHNRCLEGALEMCIFNVLKH